MALRSSTRRGKPGRFSIDISGSRPSPRRKTKGSTDKTRESEREIEPTCAMSAGNIHARGGKRGR